MGKENIKHPTDNDIREWKLKHKSVHKLTVDGKTAYLCNPDRRTLSLTMSKMAKNDVVGATEALLENCWLGGDAEIKTDDELFLSAASKVAELIQIKDAELEKL